MTIATCFLESFDPGHPTALKPHPEYLRGKAEAEAATNTQFNARHEALINYITDQQFGFAEARSSLLADLNQLFDALSKQLLPAMKDAALAAHIQDALSQLVDQTLPSKVTLFVSALDLELLEAALDSDCATLFEIKTDSSVAPGTCWLGTHAGDYMIDVANAFTKITELLSAFGTSQEERPTQHGT